MIEIIDASKIVDEELGRNYWYCGLELSQGEEAWWLSATAPGDLEESELQAHLDARKPELWRAARQKQHRPDVTLHLRERELLRRLVKVILSEINILREAAGLPPRTLKQLKQALKKAQ